MTLETHFKRIQRFYLKKEYREAYPLAEKGANEGNTDAQKFLGYFLLYGLGTTKDEAKGIYWLEKAFKNGNDESGFLLGAYFCKQRRYKEAIIYLEESAMANAAAKCRLGWCYLTGTGVDTNEKKAHEYYIDAAKSGNLWAQRQLAKLEIKNGSIIERIVGYYKLIKVAIRVFRVTLKNVDPPEMQH